MTFHGESTPPGPWSAPAPAALPHPGGAPGVPPAPRAPPAHAAPTGHAVYTVRIYRRRRANLSAPTAVIRGHRTQRPVQVVEAA